MEATGGSLRRVIIVVCVLSVIVGITVAGTLISWNSDRKAVMDFHCDGEVATFMPENEYSRPVLVVRNEDGTVVTLESWALALNERDVPAGARIIKRRSEPDGLINDRAVTVLRDQ